MVCVEFAAKVQKNPQRKPSPELRIVNAKWFYLRHSLKPNNRKNQRAEEKHPPKCSWLVKDEDTQQHRSDGSDTCPDGIGDANGDGLCGFRQKHRNKTHRDATL